MESRNKETNRNQKPEVPDPEVPEPEAPEEFSVTGVNGDRFKDEEETQRLEDTPIFETIMETGGTVIQLEKNDNGDGDRPKGLTFGLRDNPPLSIIIVYAVQVGTFLALWLHLWNGISPLIMA